MTSLPDTNTTVALASRFFIALVFAHAFVSKWPHRQELTGVIVALRILPAALAPPMAWVVLLLEGAIVVTLVTGLAALQGAVLAATLLCTFALAMAVNLWRGRRDIECGCFRDNLRQHLTWGLVARNLVFAGIALESLAEPVARASGAQDIDGLGCALALFILWLIAERLFAAQRSIAVLRKRWSST